MSTLTDLNEAVGGNTAIGEAIEPFYRRVFEDENLRPFFESTNMAHLRARQSMFLSMLLGGQAIYREREINAVHAHARMRGLTDLHFEAYLKHFRAALDEVGVRPDKVEKMMKLLHAQRGAVLIEGTVAPGEVPPPPTPQIADVEDTNPPLENEVTPAAAPAAMTAPLTPSTSDSEISQQVCDVLFPGMQLGDLSTGQMRDVLAVARRRPAAEKKRAGEGKVKNEQDIGKKAGFNFSSPLLLAS